MISVSNFCKYYWKKLKNCDCCEIVIYHSVGNTELATKCSACVCVCVCVCERERETETEREKNKRKHTEKQWGEENERKLNPELPESSFILERNKSRHENCKCLRSNGKEKHNRILM